MNAAFFVVLVALAPSPVIIDEARPSRVREYDEPRSARVNARGATRIVIVGRAGWLRVEGKDGTTEVVAEGTARAPRADLLREITLTGTREGDVVRVVVDMPKLEHRDWDSSWDNGPALDLTVTVPDNIPVEIEDSSGDLRVRGTAALDIDDNSGGVEIRDVGGALRVRDGSGELEIQNVRGDVTIDDGSGEIDVRDVTGSVTLRDGSGSITARTVGGSVHVERDGSGGIRVDDVGGDLTVERSRKRGVSYSGVRGRIRVE
ncbi:MAG TPA: DUF4097 family beta strand repeat-containing protein [Gemmatimonadaceae bacterium]|nr:DUF4097 family beta strand repeat-containing protein [Gemmatimonadaceae bacterium]